MPTVPGWIFQPVHGDEQMCTVPGRSIFQRRCRRLFRLPKRSAYLANLSGNHKFNFPFGYLYQERSLLRCLRNAVHIPMQHTAQWTLHNSFTMGKIFSNQRHAQQEEVICAKATLLQDCLRLSRGLSVSGTTCASGKKTAALTARIN